MKRSELKEMIREQVRNVFEANITSKEIFKLEKEYKNGAKALAKEMGIKESSIWSLIYRTIKYNFNSDKVISGIKKGVADEKKEMIGKELVHLGKMKIEIDKMWKQHGPIQRPWSV